MSINSPAIGRGAAAYIIASICVLTALMQLVALLMILNEAEGRAWLATADSAMRVRIILPYGIAVFLNMASGVAVYLMRVEALACMGCLLATLLARMINTPAPLVRSLDLLLLLLLIYFTMRLFGRSSAPHARAQSGWRHPLVMLFIGLSAGHLTVLVGNLKAYSMLVRIGSVTPLVALAALIGCGALYAAVLMMHSRPERAKKFFLFAALAIGLSLPGWSFAYRFSAPFWLGVPVKWIVQSGVLYMMAWGLDCSSWDDAVDWANIDQYADDPIPDEGFVVTTWHPDERLDEVFWFAKNVAVHSTIELNRTIILDIAAENRQAKLLQAFEAA